MVLSSSKDSNFLTIKGLSEVFPAFSPSALRKLVFDRRNNGLAASGCLLKIGRKRLIDVAKFEQWIRSKAEV